MLGRTDLFLGLLCSHLLEIEEDPTLHPARATALTAAALAATARTTLSPAGAPLLTLATWTTGAAGAAGAVTGGGAAHEEGASQYKG